MMRRPSLRNHPLSGRRMSLSLLMIALSMAAGALLILIYEEQVREAGLWLAWISVSTTVIAITAAYVEVRTVFPPQELTVKLCKGPNRADYQESTWVSFSNDRDNAMINAFRLEVRLEYENGTVLPIIGR